MALISYPFSDVKKYSLHDRKVRKTFFKYLENEKSL